MSTKITKLAIIAIALPALIILLLMPNASGASSDPQTACVSLYKAKCATCHAADGSGKTVMGKKLNVKDFRSPEVQKMSDADLYKVIAKGKNKMPAYEATLGADSCKQLVTYTRELGKAK